MAYLLIVTLTMLVLPVGSIVIEAGAEHGPLLWLVGKWFVFWAVGLRLLLAGLRQYLRPALTSRDLLGIESADAFILVRELGGANIASGVIGLASLAMPGFVLPAAIGGTIFYAVAGVEHAKAHHRNRDETIAMVSDFWAAAVLAGFAIGTMWIG